MWVMWVRVLATPKRGQSTPKPGPATATGTPYFRFAGAWQLGYACMLELRSYKHTTPSSRAVLR
jgi:hypothetical protein